MTQSENVNELSAALAKAQGEVTQPHKSGFNPHFKSPYAELDSIQDIARAPLSKNGLCIIESLESEGEDFFCESRLFHSSGQWVSKKCKLILFKKDMQGLGSAFTYARRYNLMGFLSVFGDVNDDDGNAASMPPPKKINANVPTDFDRHPSDEPELPFETDLGEDLGEYTVKFGKNMGKKLKTLGPTFLIDYINWLESDSKKNNKAIVGNVAEFINIAKAWLNTRIDQ